MNANRVFILGAGFSKQAGMLLATELLPLIENEFKKHNQYDALAWLGRLKEKIDWLEKSSPGKAGSINIEQVFDLAYFNVTAEKLKQHTCHLGRIAGDVPWRAAKDIESWLGQMEDDLIHVIWGEQKTGLDKLDRIQRFAGELRKNETIITFNYDTLLEESLSRAGKTCWYGFPLEKPQDIRLLKVHGSVNWLKVPRNKYQNFGYPPLFIKEDKNRKETDWPSGEEEWDYVLLRIPDNSVGLRIEKRDLQIPEKKPHSPGIAGLGRYKPLENLPGLGWVWVNAMRSIAQAEEIYVIGFSLSLFDTMARLCFADVMIQRVEKANLPQKVIIIDPNACELKKSNFRSVFGPDVPIKAIEQQAEDVDWAGLLG
jgi:hypothetical protein